MALPLHTFEPTGDPFVDDLNFCLLGGEMPLLKDWFTRNAHVLRHEAASVLADSEPYRYKCGPSEPGIYCLIADGRIEYVGKALSISSRLRDHAMRGKRFDRYWGFGGMPYEWLGHVEGFYIRRFKQRWNSANVIYNSALDEID